MYKLLIYLLCCSMALAGAGRVDRYGLAPYDPAEIASAIQGDTSYSYGPVVNVAASNSSTRATNSADYTCDGTADDVEINQALAVVASTGGVVHLAAGTYTVTQNLIDIEQSNLVLEGEGLGTIVQTTSGNANYILTVGDGTNPFSNITIRDMYIYQNPANYGTVFSYGVYIHQNVTDCKVINCKITAGMGGVYVAGTNTWILNNHFYQVGDESIQLGTSIGSKQATNNYIIGNRIEENGQRSAYYGIRSQDSDYNFVIGNLFLNCVYEAIEFSGSNYTLIADNIFINNASGAADVEINLTTSAKYTTIANNLISTTAATYCISEAAGSTYNYNRILNNYISGGTSGNVSIGNETTAYIGNIIPQLPEDRVVLTYKNTSGGQLVAGDVVVLSNDATNTTGYEFETTTTTGDSRVLGMVLGTIADDATGPILIRGKTALLKASGLDAGGGDISVGDLLCTNNADNVARKAASGNVVFALALEAYAGEDSSGVIDAILITPRQAE